MSETFELRGLSVGIRLLRERAPDWAWKCRRRGFGLPMYIGTKKDLEVTVEYRCHLDDGDVSVCGSWYVYGDGIPDTIVSWLQKQSHRFGG